MNDIEKRALAVQAAMNHKVGGITPAKYLHLNEAQWSEVVEAIIAALSAAPQAPEGWALVPVNVTPAIERVYANNSGAYQSAQELHGAMILAAKLDSPK
ncbi:hypothetical protein [Xanthomonas citri]|uniref:hypothetical protein n=1 Tax=Xanthomonas citri TaxID=346 RepID=UPI000B5C5C69|nr:hypothetical protein [Xanthomonas citri]ASL01780.1 hypothetical protein XcvCFBP7113P_16790 [Xanthomonas citri pv. vignicola]